jgi:calcineurin-like phosphoesterase family protein
MPFCKKKGKRNKMEFYNKEKNYFFTSDTEFNHKNIIKYCNRPFDNVEEMNHAIINNWNSVVKKKDIVFHLGDIGRDCETLVAQLNGTIYYVKGNHDHDSKAPYIREIQIEDLKDEYGNKQLIVLCHYSMRSWNKSHYGSFHIFGHHHNNLEPYGLSFDVGQDTHNFYPYSLDEICDKMETLKPIVDFRKENNGR